MRLQDLPRSLARRCLGVPRFCRDTLGADLAGTRLVAAYSAGLDSSALLHILALLAPRLDLTVVAAHAHHGLRPESDAELEHARDVCARLGIPLETARLDVPSALARGDSGVEERARELRYAFLESVRTAHGCDWIVTAHHADDLAEDIVMRLLRGTGWPGLGGMTGADPARRLLRPLLDWEKSELRDVLQALGAPWCEDASNESKDRTRNRVRHDILPLLRRENSALARTARQLWALARADEDYWSGLLPPLPGHVREFFLDARTLAVPQAHRLRLFKHVLDAMGPGQVLAARLFLLDRAWTEGKSGRCYQFPGDKVACVEAGGVRFGFRPRP